MGTGDCVGAGDAELPTVISGISELCKKTLDSICLTASWSKVGVKGFETASGTLSGGLVVKA